MKLVEFDDKRKDTISKDAFIHVIGPNLLQNDLLSSFLENNLRIRCRTHSDLGTSIKSKPAPDTAILFLMDCLGDRNVDPWALYNFDALNRANRLYLAFYNVHPETDLEEKALEQGVHGLIYQQESFKVLTKAVPVILSGELWYSRKIMSHCLMNGQGTSSGRVSTDMASCLTGREREILIRIATGTGNQQIADELCISLHTVKTHIYNIYKKINVRNRLQASLWAARYV